MGIYLLLCKPCGCEGWRWQVPGKGENVASPRAARKSSCETITPRLTVLCCSLLLLWVRSSKAQSKIRQINVGKTTTCGSNWYPEHWTSCKICWVFALFLHTSARFLQHSTAVFVFLITLFHISLALSAKQFCIRLEKSPRVTVLLPDNTFDNIYRECYCGKRGRLGY